MKPIVTLAAAVLLACSSASGAEPAPARVRYMVDNVDVAVQFYTRQLHFRLDKQAGAGFAILSRDNLQLILSPPEGAGGASHPMADGSRA